MENRFFPRTSLIVLMVVYYSAYAAAANCFYHEYTNKAIVKQAMRHHIGEKTGQCKIYVQNVIAAVGGSIGTGYRGCYLRELTRTGGFEITKIEEITSGCIGQISNDFDSTDDSHTHSFIVLKNFGNGVFQTIHSNYHSDRKLSIDTWNPFRHARKYPNYSVHFYNFGSKKIAEYNFIFNRNYGWKTAGGAGLVAYGKTVSYDPARLGVDPSPSILLFPTGMRANDVAVIFPARVKSPATPSNWGEGQCGRRLTNGQYADECRLFNRIVVVQRDKENFPIEYSGSWKKYEKQECSCNTINLGK